MNPPEQAVDAVLAYHRSKELSDASRLVADEAFDAAVRELQDAGLKVNAIADIIGCRASLVWKSLSIEAGAAFEDRRDQTDADTYDAVREWSWERRTVSA